VEDGAVVRNTARVNPENPIVELGPEFKKVTCQQKETKMQSMKPEANLLMFVLAAEIWNFGMKMFLKQ
jgi:UTP--glucose-1-phosphate uridylyltransferase